MEPRFWKGELGLRRFEEACFLRGLTPLRPSFADPGYDLVLHNPVSGAMWRVQVKHAWNKKNKNTGKIYWSWSVSHSGLPYKDGTFDFFVFVHPQQADQFWIVPWERCREKAGGALHPEDVNRWDRFGIEGEPLPRPSHRLDRSEHGYRFSEAALEKRRNRSSGKEVG